MITTNQLRSAFNKAGMEPDKIVRKKDGKYEIKRGFFYRHGNTAEKWATKVAEGLATSGLKVKVTGCREDWAAWPKDSYFVAIVEETV